MAKLTEKQKKFVTEYLIDLNATQAATRAGYSKKTAAYIGAENLRKPQIQAEIQKRQTKIQEKLEITQEKIIQELASIGFANGTDFVRVQQGAVLIVPTDDLPTEKKAAVAGIEQTQSGIKVKTYDKVRALELLGKYLGLFDGDNKKEQASNNLFDAINNCAKEDCDDLPELQQAPENDSDVVE